MTGDISTRSYVWIGGACVALLALLGVYRILWKPSTELCKADPQVCPCLKLLPDDREFGIKLETNNSGKLSSVDFGGSSGTGEPVSADLAEKFVQCLERTREGIEVINFSRINTSPLGQLANQWNRGGGLKINLRPLSADEQETINNLQIGPESGIRWKIMENWCASAMRDCVECSSLSQGANAVAVEVRLKESAPLRKEFWSDGWPVGQDNRKKWELVDAKGNRYLYACRPD